MAHRHTRSFLRSSSFVFLAVIFCVLGFQRVFRGLPATYARPSSANPRTTTSDIATVAQDRSAPAIAAKSRLVQFDAKPASISASFSRLPLSFEANQGQTAARVKYLSRGAGYTLFLTGDEAVFSLAGRKRNSRGENPSLAAATQNGAPRAAKREVVRMKLLDANRDAAVWGLDQLPGVSNYFIGNDHERWRRNIPQYARVKYQSVYPGIDLVYYGTQGHLEYDFVVAPGADPRRIQWNIRGARIHSDQNGELVLSTEATEVRWHPPVAYQDIDGTRKKIRSRYNLARDGRVEFELGTYDRTRTLTIDPGLAYATFIGGSDSDSAAAIAVDHSGNAYITGTTSSYDFPIANAVQLRESGGEDVFVSKIDATGTILVYSTYLGGVLDDSGLGIAVDIPGNAYITGFTLSGDFPVVNALQPRRASPDGSDAFISEIDPSGSSLIYSTFLGGSSCGGGFCGGVDTTGLGIAVDFHGNAYVVGNTTAVNFPVVNAFQSSFGGGLFDIFVSKIATAGAALAYSTYLGGTGNDSGSGIALDVAGDAYIVGTTATYGAPNDFPLMNAWQPTYGGGNSDAIVAKFDSTGMSLLFSTYLGGSGDDTGAAIAVGANCFVTGTTTSTDFPVRNAFQPTYAGGNDAFVSRLDSLGRLNYSTYLGGTGDDSGTSIAVDISDNIFVGGSTSSSDFPTLSSFQRNLAGGNDGFVTKFQASGSLLNYSSYIGGSGSDRINGISVDDDANAYLAGGTSSSDFPTLNAIQPTYGGGGSDAFVVKVLQPAPTTTSLLTTPNPSVAGLSVLLTATISSSGGGSPRGKMEFVNGQTILGTVGVKAGVAQYRTSQLPVGSNPLQAIYLGDPNFAGSTSQIVKQVVLESTTNSLDLSPSPSVFDQPVTFVSIVSSSAGFPPDGEIVTFLRGSKVLGTAALSGGEAKFSFTSLPVGSNAIKAVYGGDATFAASTSKIEIQTVNAATTTTTLVSSQNPSKVGTSVTFTATVTPQFAGAVNGTVSFLDNNTILQTVKLTNNDAICTTAKLVAGSHQITATYSGSTNFTGSSAQLTQTVQ